MQNSLNLKFGQRPCTIYIGGDFGANFQKKPWAIKLACF